MNIYTGIVAVLCFAVEFLLLLGTNRLCGHSVATKRIVLAALVGGIYGAVCFLPKLHFLGNALWRMVNLGVVGWIAFGRNEYALRCVTVYILLRMAMSGIAIGIGENGLETLVLSATALTVLYMVGLRDGLRTAAYIPIELKYRGKSMRLTALRDTGNTLRDPVTGRSVLIVGADTANELLGLTREQLCSPIETVSSGYLPGLRLVPYRSIERTGGLLLALCLQEVKIGTWCGSSLVAFAPVVIGIDGVYQALTGG